MHRRTWVYALLVGMTPAIALGQTGDKAIAEALFVEARMLAAQGKYDQACPKFAESQKLDPAPGTMLNLADCYEQQGKTASAWAAWLEAAAAAKDRGQVDRERVARGRAAALQPQLSYLTIEVPPWSQVDGLSVTSNGISIGEALWGTSMPVDPDTYIVAASAPRRQSWQTEITVQKGLSPPKVTVPPLGLVEPAVPPPAAPQTEAPASPPAVAVPPPAPPAGEPPLTPTDAPTPDADQSAGGSTQRTLGYVLGGVGILGVGIGSYFGYSAMSKKSESEGHCRTDKYCDPQGVELRNDAIAAGNASTLAFGLGIVALAGGVSLVLTAPSRARADSQEGPAVALAAGAVIGRRSGVFSVSGAF